MRRPPRSQAGFTLIEVLVALALMALVSLMAWRGLASVSGARERIEEQAEDIDAIVRTLGQMARDVELSYTGPGFEPGRAGLHQRPAPAAPCRRRARVRDPAPRP
jgi:general secretion pathway protein J